MELDAPPAPPSVANGVFNDIAVVGSAVAYQRRYCLRTPSWNLGPDGAASTVADRTWGPNGPASAVAGGGRSPAPLPADAYYWEPDSPVGATLGADGRRP
jgi:hypothetical protein